MTIRSRLTARPSRERSGKLTWRAEVPGRDPVVPAAARSIHLRQGELLRFDLPLPTSPGAITIQLELADAAGRAALRQLLTVSFDPRRP